MCSQEPDDPGCLQTALLGDCERDRSLHTRVCDSGRGGDVPAPVGQPHRVPRSHRGPQGGRLFGSEIHQEPQQRQHIQRGRGKLMRLFSLS